MTRINIFGSLKQKLYFLIVGVVLLFGLSSTFVGTYFIQSMTLREAQTRVGNNLQSAWAVLHAEQDRIQQTVTWISQKNSLHTKLIHDDMLSLRTRLKQLKNNSHFDFLTITDNHGVTVIRTSYKNILGDDTSTDDFVKDALAGNLGKGFHLFPPERLDLEGDNLSHKAFMLLKSTPHSKPIWQKVETRGMVMVASSPILDENGQILGTIYGGTLLNRNFELVDTIRSIVFGDESYKGQMVGTVTIFQWDARIATNVMDQKGLRALGTRVSEEVYDRTLENGLPWYGRAFVVRDWYISAYEPIVDTHGEIIGMLYVGALEKKYNDMKTKLFCGFIGFSLLWVFLMLLISMQVSRKIINPIMNLAGAARQVSSGSLDVDIPFVKSRDEIRELNEAFKNMLSDIKEREETLLKVNRDLTTSNRNYMEMLSFVSHELKNQIAGSSIAVRTLQRNTASRLEQEDMKLLEKLGDAMGYLGEMLKNYLDLSRLESKEFSVSRKKINFLAEVVVPTLERLSILIDKKNILIKNQNDAKLEILTDPGLLNIIYSNLLHNAIKFCREGGIIILSSEEREDSFQFKVWNEGEGISKETQERLFEKFFRFDVEKKDRAPGSGLGLYITKTLTEMLGGTIWVESEEGAWAAFYVNIPKVSSQSEGV